MALSAKLSVAEGRSREGAWIEIDVAKQAAAQHYVAPARERGLKYHSRSR